MRTSLSVDSSVDSVVKKPCQENKWDEYDQGAFIRTVYGETLLTTFEYLKIGWSLLVSDRDRWFWHQSLIISLVKL